MLEIYKNFGPWKNRQIKVSKKVWRFKSGKAALRPKHEIFRKLRAGKNLKLYVQKFMQNLEGFLKFERFSKQGLFENTQNSRRAST